MQEANDIYANCSICGKKQRILTMKLDKDSEELVCQECFEQKAEKRPLVREETFETGTLDMGDLEGKAVKFRCLKCKYKFARKPKSKAAKRCPYCSSVNIEEEKECEAERLLKEADDEKFKF